MSKLPHGGMRREGRELPETQMFPRTRESENAGEPVQGARKGGFMPVKNKVPPQFAKKATAPAGAKPNPFGANKAPPFGAKPNPFAGGKAPPFGAKKAPPFGGKGKPFAEGGFASGLVGGLEAGSRIAAANRNAEARGKGVSQGTDAAAMKKKMAAAATAGPEAVSEPATAFRRGGKAMKKGAC